MKKTKSFWFKSTIVVLLSLFILSSGLGIWRYGWETVLDESLKYLIGASFTGLMIAIVGYFLKNKKIW